MERDGEQLSARPALETEGLRFLHVTGELPRAAGKRGGAAMFGASSSAALRVRPRLAGPREALALLELRFPGPRAGRGWGKRNFTGAALPWAAPSGFLFIFCEASSWAAVSGIAGPLAFASRPHCSALPCPPPLVPSRAAPAPHGHPFLSIPGV